MRLVIDIPEGMREALIQGCFGARYSLYELVGCVMRGTVLPKGYSRLIIEEDGTIHTDTTRDCKTCGHSNDGKCAGTEECHDCMWESKYIEADKESEE